MAGKKIKITLPVFLNPSNKMRMDVRCNRCVDNYKKRAVKVLSSVKAKIRPDKQVRKILLKVVEERDQNLAFLNSIPVKQRVREFLKNWLGIISQLYLLVDLTQGKVNLLIYS